MQHFVDYFLNCGCRNGDARAGRGVLGIIEGDAGARGIECGQDSGGRW